MTKNNQIIIIAGGSFQGKSLISLAIAHRMLFSGVLTTDTVRNILKVLQPDNKFLGTSTYLLSPTDLEKQKRLVSETLVKIIEIYENRGEKIILEGMHFSHDFFSWTREKGFCRVCVDNQLPLEKRIEFKCITRTKLRNLNYETININEKNSKFSSKNTSYFQYKNRIDCIHNQIVEEAKRADYEIIQYCDINDAIDNTYNFVNSY